MKTMTVAALCGLILAAGVVLRVWDITADLPPYFSGGSQDFTTDAAYLTLYAKSAVQFGTWDLFGFEPWSAFKISVVSGTSYLLFELFGVSRATMAVCGTVLQMFGLAFILAGCARCLGVRALAAVAMLFSTNYLLVLFGRLPFSENGLLFFAGAGFLVYAYWFEYRWGKVLLGVLIALAALLGKSFGFLMAGGPMLHILLVHRKTALRDSALVLVPIAAITLLFSSLFHGPSGMLGFLYEHGVGEHGAPHGFTSPIGFFESLISISSTELHEYTPALSGLVYLALLSMLMTTSASVNTRRLDHFMLGWMAAWLVALSPFQYHPLRYLYIIIVPMIVLLASSLERLRQSDLAVRRSWNWWQVALLGLVNWYASFALAKALFFDTRDPAAMYRLVWLSLPIALGASLAILLITRFLPSKVSLTRSVAVVATIGALVIATDLWQFKQWFAIRTHQIDHANQDATALLGPGAVVAGQYGPAITSESRLGSLRIFLRENLSEFRQQLSDFPVTHLAISSQALTANLDKDLLLRSAPVLATYRLRDASVKLIRVNHLTGNASAAAYQPTPFELAIDLRMAGRWDDALHLLDSFLTLHPRNKAALMERYYLALQTGGLPAAESSVEALCSEFADDYVVTLLAAIYYRHVAEFTGNDLVRVGGETLLASAVQLSGPQAENTLRMYRSLSPGDRIPR